MRVAIFGATGGTGRHLVAQALRRGHELRVLARRPESVPVQHPRLTVVAGDVLVEGSCGAVVDGADVVLSALGSASLRATTLYSTGTANIIRAMRASRARRLVCVSSTGPFVRGDPGVNVLFKALLPVIFHAPYADMRRMEAQVKTSELDWMLVRATRLTNGARTDTYRVCTDGTPAGGWQISRADLAGFMLDHVQRRDYVHRAPAIAY